MADYTAKKLADAQVPLRTAATSYITKDIAFFTGMVGTAGEFVEFFDLPKGAEVREAFVDQQGSIGGTTTAQLVLGSLDLTAATTAGGADCNYMSGNSVAPQVLSTATTVKVRVGTANVAAAATVRVGVVVEPTETGLTS